MCWDGCRYLATTGVLHQTLTFTPSTVTIITVIMVVLIALIGVMPLPLFGRDGGGGGDGDGDAASLQEPWLGADVDDEDDVDGDDVLGDAAERPVLQRTMSKHGEATPLGAMRTMDFVLLWLALFCGTGPGRVDGSIDGSMDRWMDGPSAHWSWKRRRFAPDGFGWMAGAE